MTRVSQNLRCKAAACCLHDGPPLPLAAYRSARFWLIVATSRSLLSKRRLRRQKQWRGRRWRQRKLPAEPAAAPSALQRPMLPLKLDLAASCAEAGKDRRIILCSAHLPAQPPNWPAAMPHQGWQAHPRRLPAQHPLQHNRSYCTGITLACCKHLFLPGNGESKVLGL